MHLVDLHVPISRRVTELNSGARWPHWPCALHHSDLSHCATRAGGTPHILLLLSNIR